MKAASRRYSQRRAIMGSTRVARLAGIHAAMMATPIKSVEIATSVKSTPDVAVLGHERQLKQAASARINL